MLSLRHTAARLSRVAAHAIRSDRTGGFGQRDGPSGRNGPASHTLASLHLQGFSREQEFEADTLGVRYMSRVGYDPKAMATFLSQLRAHSGLRAKIAGRPAGSVDQLDIMATHPRTIERIHAQPTRPDRNHLMPAISTERPIRALSMAWFSATTPMSASYGVGNSPIVRCVSGSRFRGV